jgi:hypothetical protein
MVQDGPIDGGMVDPFQEIKYAQSSIGRTRPIAIVFCHSDGSSLLAGGCQSGLARHFQVEKESMMAHLLAQ